MSDARATTGAGSPSAGPVGPGIRVLGGSPTPEELAAATAVLAALAAQPAVEQPIRRAPDAWQRSQRSVRGPVVPGPGRWRGFTG